MKTKIIGLLICLITAISCTRNNIVIVNGKVNDKALNGSMVYVMKGEGSKEIAEDSAVIRNNTFILKLIPDTLKIRTLRISNQGSAAAQDLIFIKEPGNIDVIMGSKSEISGTRLNKILADWTKSNYEYDSVQYDLYYKTGIPGISNSFRDSVFKLSALTDSLYFNRVYEILDQNTDNGIGLLLFGVYYEHLPLKTRKRILDLKGNEYMQRDLYIWTKVKFDKELQKLNGSGE